ncbi:hypothetical protein CERSUDRAFT_115033 [Gelatoporia subvermispora B]|uniref:Uncharacterized protein n=1 Tax=Ceriporiopsis subvermispora (strain B) TaxID=914234 RepID=M2QJ90_CERS8|nr:hypothetical protein CERSUDRAFT_115033 [Gelatoporia subvermispora B]
MLLNPRRSSSRRGLHACLNPHEGLNSGSECHDGVQHYKFRILWILGDGCIAPQGVFAGDLRHIPIIVLASPVGSAPEQARRSLAAMFDHLSACLHRHVTFDILSAAIAKCTSGEHGFFSASPPMYTHAQPTRS